MQGRRVERTWWWDCHGLPIEEKVQKKLGLKSNKEIEANGVKNFIDECYKYTSEVSSEWNWYIDKIGRWVDMDNAYRTMDQDYMESVMWVFSELYKKWLVYEWKRVSLYSWKLGTPISNFEVAMDDTYQEVNDPAITVKFLLEENDKFPEWTSILAWTTTPWTIPANMALAVRNDIDYVLVNLAPPPEKGESDGVTHKGIPNNETPPNLHLSREGWATEQFIVAKNRLETVFKWKWEYTVIREFKGSELVGVGYIPPFPEYYYDKFRQTSPLIKGDVTEWQGDLASEKIPPTPFIKGEPNKNHKIYHADFITDTDGTWIGHEAPEFGEVDFQLAKKEGIHISNAMDEAGRYTAEIYDMEWIHYLDLENPEKWANRINIERMKGNNTLFKLEGITHRVPFCPRSGTPLMQKAQKSWFIDIQSQKDKLVEANEQINWFPEYLKEWRFKKGLETAPDWCISRTRYWGAPMPVWIAPLGNEEPLVISSREEIFEYNKSFWQLEKKEVEGKITYFFKWWEFDGLEFNLHKPYIDVIKLRREGGTELTRIPEVLDVWMDSGSMPYAQMHYPFENREAMQASFPADFIAEYVGQIRAWFYVMHVLGVLLNPTGAEKPTPSFTNVITTGIVNGNDGRKMSKSFGNYPDPRMAIEKYGADPIRFYMLNSPLLSGGDMDFKEEGIMDTIKWVMLPIWNTYSFFTTYANIDKWEKDDTEVWFSRHAESTSNIAWKMSDGTDNPALTEKGEKQAKSAGEMLRTQGKKFDIIIHTSRVRTINTAHIIGDTIGFSGEYILDDGFTEQSAGEFSGMTHEELLNYHNQKTEQNIIFSKENIRRIYKEHGGENIDTFTARIIPAYESILQKYKGKRILIIAHAGSVRPIIDHYFGQGKEVAHFDITIHNADPFRLITTPIVNPLDQWILSKLQVLIGQVHDAMEGYDISRGCRAITDYMDELTNWYVRLSRRRFWESGMTDDKKSAYETLYTVLTEVSKLLAPLMPFLSENIWKGLTDRSPLIKGDVMKWQGDFAPEANPPNPLYQGGMDSNSVHLEYITRPNKHLVANDLNRDMGICEHIVSLGLTIRSKHNIRVRQPLQKIILDTTLNEYYLEIIKNELNIKEVICEKAKDFTAKICKVNARKVWPKYGKDMQEIIYWGKQWAFQENIDGTITINPNKFEMWQSFHYNDWPVTNNWKSWLIDGADWEIVRIKVELEEWVKKELGWYLEIEEWFNMVIALDTTITGALRLEGYARDIIRAIQDMRKEADYQVTDRVEISISGWVSSEIVSQWQWYIEKETLSHIVEWFTGPDLEKTICDEAMGTIQLSIKK